MKDLVEFIEESLLDMEEPDESIVIEHALLELFKSYLPYTNKIHNLSSGLTLYFHKKHNHEIFNNITKDFGDKLIQMGINGNPESGVIEQGSLKIYYNDYVFLINKIQINADFSYTYRKIINRKDYTDFEDEIPEHGLLQITISGKDGKHFFKNLKKELIK